MKPTRRLGRLLRLTRPRAAVLLYHRVGARGLDPWGLAVTPANFRSQMEAIASRWHVISLDELLRSLRMRDLPERSVAVTFDDGYADNLANAAPVLIEHGIPATLFVATGLLERRREPWWDELGALLLQPESLPSTLQLQVAGHRYRWAVPPATEDDRRHQAEGTSPWDAASGSRLATYYEVWRVLRAADDVSRDRALEQIALWAGLQRPYRSARRTLTESELGEFAALSGMAVGAHTVTHPALTSCSADTVRQELRGSAEWLRERLDTAPLHFAYPFGAWNRVIARTVEALGYQSGFTTAAEPVGATSYRYALGRLPAEDCTGLELEQRLVSFA